MLIKSGIITSQSGSFGGMTGSHNSGGLYFRARSIPVNPNTAKQQSARSSMASLVSAWQSLTDAQRDGWRTYSTNVPIVGPLGDPRPVGGIGMYVRSNVPRLAASAADAVATPLARIDDAPIIYDIGSFTPATLTATAAAVSVAFDNSDAWANETGGALLIQTGLPVSVAVGFYKAPFRYGPVTIVAGDNTTPPTSPKVVPVPGGLSIGQRIFVRVRATRADGRLSTAQILTAIAA